MKTRIYQNPIKKTEENENSATSARVYRGGSWGNGARSTRVSSRGADHPGGEDFFLGFRIARNPKR